MTRRATVTEAEYRRAIKAARECGLTVRACEITPQRVVLHFGGDEGLDLPAPQDKAGEPKPWPKLAAV